MSKKICESITSHPWLLTFLVVVLVGVISVGEKHLGFTGHYSVFFEEENKIVEAYGEIQEVYGKSDNILIAIGAEGEDIFSPEILSLVQELTEKAWTLPYVSRVDSITNFQHSYAAEDDLVVGDLVDNKQTLTPDRIDHVKQVAASEAILSGRLLSLNNEVTGINLTVRLPGNSPTELPELVASARALAEEYRQRYPDVTIHLAGEVMLTNAFIEASMHDLNVLTPLMFLIVIGVFVVMLRSFWGTLAGVLYCVLCIKGAMGVAGWSGMTLTPPTAVAPTIVMTIAVATFIHVFTTFMQSFTGSRTKKDAAILSLKLNFKPISLTSLTTIIGFLSMNFSDVPPFRDLGNVVACGVIICYILSLTLLPCILLLIPVKSNSKRQPFVKGMNATADFVIRNAQALCWTSLAFGVVCLALIPLNEISEKFIEQFSQEIEFRHAAEYVNENLTGVYNIEYSVDSDESGGLYSPAYLQKVDLFVKWLRQREEVVHVSSITDTLKRINKNLHEDNQEWYQLPDNKDAVAQYILLYEMSLPYGLDLNDQISLEKSSTRVIVTFGNLSTKEVIELEETIQAWIDSNIPSLSVQSASPTLMFSHIGDTNVKSMLIGTMTAFALIAVLLTISFRSIRYGTISMLANVLPITTAFGIWGLLVGEVGMGVSVVAGMTIGIVVDDTVHFISKYIYARNSLGLSPEESISYCFSSVGVAILTTTAVLVSGFAVISFSDFSRNSNMAVMNMITIFLALVYDFVFLPSLILIMERIKNEKKYVATSFKEKGGADTAVEPSV